MPCGRGWGLGEGPSHVFPFMSRAHEPCGQLSAGDEGVSFSQGLKEMASMRQIWDSLGWGPAVGTRGWYLPALGFQDRVTSCVNVLLCAPPTSLSEADRPAFTACSTCSMTYHVLWA